MYSASTDGYQNAPSKNYDPRGNTAREPTILAGVAIIIEAILQTALESIVKSTPGTACNIARRLRPNHLQIERLLLK